MKKLRLPQPYASMVVAGVLQTIPNKWDDVAYNEQIFIYADDIEEEYKGEPDHNKPLHRKIYNEQTLGNLKYTYPSDVYLGFVTVYHTGVTTEGWLSNGEKILFVNGCHEFILKPKYFETSFSYLSTLESRSKIPNRIKLDDFKVIVPVSKETWNEIINEEGYKGFCLFWESYMQQLTTALTKYLEAHEDETYQVLFEFDGKHVTCYGDDLGLNHLNISKNKNEYKLVEILDFSLEDICNVPNIYINSKITNKSSQAKENDDKIFLTYKDVYACDLCLESSCRGHQYVEQGVVCFVCSDCLKHLLRQYLNNSTSMNVDTYIRKAIRDKVIHPITTPKKKKDAGHYQSISTNPYYTTRESVKLNHNSTISTPQVSMRESLRGIRGERVEGHLACSRCGKQYTSGWSYRHHNKYIQLCPDCHDTVKCYEQVRFISTPMGGMNKRRK